MFSMVGSRFTSVIKPVAFRTFETGLVVRENDWGLTTGKHLNAIDGGEKSKRVSGDVFEKMLAKHLG